MKWGVRRYQNPDGSLTKAGKARYGNVGNSKVHYKIKTKSPFEKKRAKLEKQEQKMSEKEEIMRRKNELKERKENLKNQGKNEKKVDTSKPKNAKDMTYQELQQFVARYEMEQKYNKIVNGPEKKKGSNAAKDILSKYGDTLVKSGGDAFGTVSKNVMIYLLETLAESKIEGYKNSKDKKKDSRNNR